MTTTIEAARISASVMSPINRYTPEAAHSRRNIGSRSTSSTSPIRLGRAAAGRLFGPSSARRRPASAVVRPRKGVEGGDSPREIGLAALVGSPGVIEVLVQCFNGVHQELNGVPGVVHALAAVLQHELVVVQGADHFDRVLDLVADERSLRVVKRILHRLQEPRAPLVDDSLEQPLYCLRDGFDR